MTSERYAVILVYSTSHAIRAEQVLFKAGISAKLIPVPRHLSSNCGTCLQIERADVEKARQALQAAHVEIEGIHEE
jgi:hypothetical protein